MPEGLEPTNNSEKRVSNSQEYPDESVKHAVMVIGEIKQQCAVMGANDFEIPALDRILEALNKGECTPEEAIREAQKIIDKKSDYH